MCKCPKLGAILDNFDLENLDFDREYLQNGLKYQKWEKQLITYDAFHVKPKAW